MYLLGSSLGSALLFVALTTVLLGLVIYLASRAWLGAPLALVAAVWFALLPAVQEASSSIMIDILCTLFSVTAAVMFGRYLDSERPRDALLFALFACAAILTKHNAFALALLPPLAIAVAGRWRLLRSWTLWLIPAVVLVICLPWHVFTWDVVRYASGLGKSSVSKGAAKNLAILVREPGLLFLPLTALGVWSRLIPRARPNGFWCSLFALGVSEWVFHSLIHPLSASRYLLPALASSILFTVAGLQWVAQHWRGPRLGRIGSETILAGLVLALFALTTFRIPVRSNRGFAKAADAMLASGMQENATALVSSDTVGEGAFVAEVAAREPLPQRIVLRGSKLLASGDWTGKEYEARYADDASLMAALDRARVEFIAIDDANDELHHLQLRGAVEGSDWWVDVSPSGLSTGLPRSAVRLYRRREPLPPGEPAFELDMTHSLGHNLSHEG
jgi:4-amino-4-deoxy-L-arabinose transferase-like glycosyltransferase